MNPDENTLNNIISTVFFLSLVLVFYKIYLCVYNYSKLVSSSLIFLFPVKNLLKYLS